MRVEKVVTQIEEILKQIMIRDSNKPRQQSNKDTDEVKPRINQFQFEDSPTAVIFYFFHQSKHTTTLHRFIRMTYNNQNRVVVSDK